MSNPKSKYGQSTKSFRVHSRDSWANLFSVEEVLEYLFPVDAACSAPDP